MSTERFHFLTILGQAAGEVEAACEAVLACRVEDHPWLPGGGNYGPVAHRRLERLCQSLLASADSLPVLHHATHVYGWALGNHALARLPWPDGRVRAVLGLNLGVAFYPSRQADGLLAEAAKARRSAARAGRRLDSWYEDGVSTAIAAGQIYPIEYMVAVVAECVGASLLDDDVHRSAHASIPGIPRDHVRIGKAKAARRSGRSAGRASERRPHGG